MSNTHDGDEKIPTPSTLGRIRVNDEPPITEIFIIIGKFGYTRPYKKFLLDPLLHTLFCNFG